MKMCKGKTATVDSRGRRVIAHVEVYTAAGQLVAIKCQHCQPHSNNKNV